MRTTELSLGIMLSEISQRRQTNIAQSHLYVGSKKAEVTATENILVTARSWGLGKLRRC